MEAYLNIILIHTVMMKKKLIGSRYQKAVQYMAKRRIGALIVFERKETGLQDYIETGIAMNSEISQELLINIYTKYATT